MSNESSKINMQGDQEFLREEFLAKTSSGMPVLFGLLVGNLISIIAFILGIVIGSSYGASAFNVVIGVILAILGGLLGFIVIPISYAGLKVIKPNEAMVLTLFGKYVGTLKGEGFYYVNPFVTAVPPARSTVKKSGDTEQIAASITTNGMQVSGMEFMRKRISLKVMTLSNEKQKINDQLGNPIIIGIVVIWRVVNTAKATFNVDDYVEFLSTQCDSALRNIVRLYPYDTAGSDNEKTLRGSSQEIAANLKLEIQQKVDVAGLEIQEARITHLSYAPEIAAAMLQRQQASAIIDARQMIVEGAVGMVEMALEKLNEKDIVHLDEERKAAMVSNLLVVLCGNKDAQPIVNSGSIY